MSASDAWRVMRKDYSNNLFILAPQLGEDFLDQISAETLAATFNAKGHHQFYWAEPANTPLPLDIRL